MIYPLLILFLSVVNVGAVDIRRVIVKGRNKLTFLNPVDFVDESGNKGKLYEIDLSTNSTMTITFGVPRKGESK